jgi:hypothetical protein
MRSVLRVRFAMAASFACSCQGVPAIACLRQSVWRKADADFGIDDLFNY